MKIELKSLFKNKVIISVLIFLLMCHYTSAHMLKSSSQTRIDNLTEMFSGYVKDIVISKPPRYSTANIHDRSENKELYNNFVGTMEYIQRGCEDYVNRVESGEDILLSELIEWDILTDIMFGEMSSMFINEETDTPTRVYPEKVRKFQDNVDFEYDLTALGYIPQVYFAQSRDDAFAYLVKNIETKIDNYYNGKMSPIKTEYSIYNFIRSTNYGDSGTWSYWVESLALAILPLVIFQQIYDRKATGTIKNIFLRPVSKYKVFMFLLIIFFILGLVMVYIPKLAVDLYVYIGGERYPANTDVIVYEDGLTTYSTSTEKQWNYSIYNFTDGMTNYKVGTNGENLSYDDLISISFSRFISYVLTIDILKILFIVLVSLTISLYTKNRVISLGSNVLMSIIVLMSKGDFRTFFMNKYNPFVIPNGWRITLGREYISFYNALLLLIISIVIVFIISMVIVKNREIE